MTESDTLQLFTHRSVATAASIRAARAILGWSQQQLADKANVSVAALNRLERLDTEPRMKTIFKLQSALTLAGVTFTVSETGDCQVMMKSRLISDLKERHRGGEVVTARGTIQKGRKEPPTDS